MSGPATTSIPQLPVGLALTGTEVFPAVQNGVDKQFSANTLLQFFGPTAARIVVGSTLVANGVGGRVLFDNAGVLGEYAQVPAAAGGTGIGSYTVGDLLYASAATTLSRLAAASAGSVLVSTGVGAAPAYVSAVSAAALLSTTYVVPTVAALRALPFQPPLVVTEGYSSVNDGGGGPPWSWNVTSTVVDDGFMTLKPTSVAGAGRYQRQLQAGASVSPKWGGCALGGNDDAAQFAKIVASASSIDMSNCRVSLVNAVNITNSSACAKIFSDGTGTFVPGLGTTSATIWFNISRDSFWFDGIYFNLPISHTAGVFPAMDRAFVITSQYQSRFTNCEYSGGKTGPNWQGAGGAALDSRVWCVNNYIHDCLGQALSIDAPYEVHINDNVIENTGFDSSLTSGVIRLNGLTFTTIAPADCIIHNNTIANCNVSFTQEAVDLSGTSYQNMVVSDNLIDNVGYGGFELKTSGTSSVSDVFRNWLYQGNMVIWPTVSAQGLGVAINNVAGFDGKETTIKIIDNYFIGVTASNVATTTGVLVSKFDNVTIANNTMLNLNQGINVNPASGAGTQQANNVDVIGNNVLANTAFVAPARLINDMRVLSNIFVSVSAPAFQANGATINRLTCLSNYMETKAVNAAMELRDIQGGRIIGNILLGGNAGILVQGASPTNLRIIRNDISVTAGPAFTLVTASASMIITNNTCSIPLANRIVEGAAATIATIAGNERDPQAVDPSAGTAGSKGDIVRNTNPATGGVWAWACVTAGAAGAATFKGLPINS